MENIYLTHQIARWYWAYSYTGAKVARDYARTGMVKNCERSPQKIQKALAATVFSDQEIHVLLSSNCAKPADGIHIHTCTLDLPRNAFIRLEEGVYIASPELCFLQAAQHTSFLKTVQYGTNLCGRFILDSYKESGTDERDPITSVKKIATFLNSCPEYSGVKGAKKALQYVMDNSASPRETDGGLVLSLPKMHGGYGLYGMRLNKKIPIPKSKRNATDSTFFRADFFWEDSRVTAEYDSDSDHLSSGKMTSDRIRYNAFQHLGYRNIGITRNQLNSLSESDRVAEILRKELGRKPRPDPKNYYKKKLNLRKELGLPIYY